MIMNATKHQQSSSENLQIPEGLGAVSMADMQNLQEIINTGYKHFAKKKYNIYGQPVDRSHLLNLEFCPTPYWSLLLKNVDLTPNLQ